MVVRRLQRSDDQCTSRSSELRRIEKMHVQRTAAAAAAGSRHHYDDVLNSKEDQR
jgi:hypothetical protein